MEDNVRRYSIGLNNNMEYPEMPRSSIIHSLDHTSSTHSTQVISRIMHQPREQTGIGQTVASVDVGRSEGGGFPPHIRNRIIRLSTIKRAARGENVDTTQLNSNQKDDATLDPKPKVATFQCPVCLGQLVEETSTKCGHIFCKECITNAIKLQGKCPICRRKLGRGKTTISRVYLPSITYINNIN